MSEVAADIVLTVSKFHACPCHHSLPFTVGWVQLVNKQTRALMHRLAIVLCEPALGCLSMREIAVDVVLTIRIEPFPHSTTGIFMFNVAMLPNSPYTAD